MLGQVKYNSSATKSLVISEVKGWPIFNMVEKSPDPSELNFPESKANKVCELECALGIYIGSSAMKS